ncbi:HTH-type transcriptional regulator HdfR [Zobellella taiwanensis]|uniref:HTH-type transcriptional regulator HdfR n=1 Tax=Zobellella taiwanensis TaxID=347535 RepID=A0A2P7QX87_9GAMM|nr:HTH-type transcriptional regulator HdfR [Zobellella taiwanensis]PSJ42571.1 HTH-type transcriptional regulator HdfR [Zobellella taiwanensis]
MDTELLKTFLEVSRTRHFGKAAEHLYLTPSAVSFRIRQLESQLGVTLFTRLRNNIQLTSSGEALIPHAESMLLAWARAQHEVALSERQTQQLAVAGTANLWDAYLQDGLHRLYCELPALSLRADIRTPEQMTRALLGRTLDLAFLTDPARIEGVRHIAMHTMELQLVSTYPNLDAEKAMAQDYIRIDWGTAFNTQHAKLFNTATPPLLHTGSVRIALEYLLHHGGSAFLPSSMIKIYQEQERLFLVDKAPAISREVYAAYLPGGERQTLIDRVIELFGPKAEPVS